MLNFGGVFHLLTSNLKKIFSSHWDLQLVPVMCLQLLCRALRLSRQLLIFPESSQEVYSNLKNLDLRPKTPRQALKVEVSWVSKPLILVVFSVLCLKNLNHLKSAPQKLRKPPGYSSPPKKQISASLEDSESCRDLAETLRGTRKKRVEPMLIGTPLTIIKICIYIYMIYIYIWSIYIYDLYIYDLYIYDIKQKNVGFLGGETYPWRCF